MKLTKLDKACRIAITDCMATKKKESVLVVTDELTNEIGRALYLNALDLGHESLLVEIKSWETHGQEPPKYVSELMKEFNVVLLPTRKSLTHTNARRAASALGVRVATFPGITTDVMIRGLSADYKKIAALTLKMKKVFDKTDDVRITAPNGTDISLKIGGRKAIASKGLFHKKGEGGKMSTFLNEAVSVGDELEVFIYQDNENRLIATTKTPNVVLDEFAVLKVKEVNGHGAFLDWGLEKHLLVPFREQRNKMQEGQWYVVYCYLDERSNRLVASNKLDKFLSNEELTVRVREKVELVVTRKTDLGWEVIINNLHKGLVYANEVFKKISVGDIMPGIIKAIRGDNKIDISLQPLGQKILEPAANKIYETLKHHKGFLALNDKSNPEAIKEELQMSKKTFKKGIGTLYKARKIDIKNDGIYLVESE